MEKAFVKKIIADERGATAVEYALIALVVGIGIIGSLTSFEAGLSGLINSVVEAFQSFL